MALTSSYRLSVQYALPRLVDAYGRGVLVPFLGAGMSAGVCPSWPDLVAALEVAASDGSTGTSEHPVHANCEAAADAAASLAAAEARPGADELPRRANHAIRALLRRSANELSAVIRAALYGWRTGARVIPDQTTSLAQLWWPLVLTTNYDDLFARAYAKAHWTTRRRDTALADAYEDVALRVLGREPADCRQVLGSLDATQTSILWALHGFLPQSHPTGRRYAAAPDLERELVVGHEEYRRVAHASVHYRRAFAEVCRRRSLLFVGAGLRDAYLLDLFAEVQELYGPGPHPHFALLRRGEVDPEFLRTRLNIFALEYDEYSDLPRHLDSLAEGVHVGQARPTQWHFQLGRDASGLGTESRDGAELEIAYGGLPASLGSSALAVSAGFRGGRGADERRPWVSGRLWDDLDRLDPRFMDAVSDRHGRGDHLHATGAHVHEWRGPAGERPCQIIAVTSWADPQSRDLRRIGEAATAAFGWALARGYPHLRMLLLAAGQTRHFAARFSLAEIVRAFGKWRRAGDGETGGTPFRLTIHVRPLPAVFELTSGRMDVVELLTSNDVRFWIEVDDGRSEVARELVFYPEEAPLRTVAADQGVHGSGWIAMVQPQPLPRADLDLSVATNHTLRDVGILPGATLRLVRRRP